MHELTIAESLICIIEDKRNAQHFKKVRRITIAIGVLSAVEPEALRFCFDLASQNTIADGAELTIISVAGMGQCPQCKMKITLEERYTPCPQCEILPVTITGGDDMRIVELEVV